jgi:lipoate-protein ligase A
MPRWLLLQDPPLAGENNMARDRAVYSHFSELNCDGVLRFFLWERPTLSLGRFQNDPDLEKRCAELTLPVVRRPTGGQAILHGSDLCWSVISHAQGPLGKDLQATYQQLSRVAITALAQLGLSLQMPEKHQDYRRQASCFASLTSADLEIAGQKLIGSAQMRNRRVFLQQSSLSLSSPALLQRVFPDSPDGQTRPQTSLADWLPELTIDVLIATLSRAFAQELNLEFESAEALVAAYS